MTQLLRHAPTFFLELASRGKDAWNGWIHIDPANATEKVTFARTDFSQPPWDQIDFAGFEFGEGADFSGCTWRGVEWPEIRDAPDEFHPGRASFSGATFGDGATFADSALGGFANFRSTQFGRRAEFANASFGERSSFRHASFDFGAIFSGAKFGPQTTFEHAGFNESADFSRANFGKALRFTGARFGNATNFANAVFDDAVNFRSVRFGDDINFAEATFNDTPQFDCATIGNGVAFLRTKFGNQTNFRWAIFGNSANFGEAIFGDNASFAGASFGHSTNFNNITFASSVSFSGAAFGQALTFADVTFGNRVYFIGMSREEWFRNSTEPLTNLTAHDQSRALHGSSSDCFLAVSFTKARFQGEAIFSGRSFDGAANFTNAQFHEPPNFDGVTKAGRIDFTGAKISLVPPNRPHWTLRSDVALRLRALRKIAEDTKNHDLERDLYIEERKAERGIYLHHHFRAVWRDPKKISALVSHIFWIGVMFVYWALADYGRSFIRPLIWLLASVFFFRWRYEVIFAPIVCKAVTLRLLTAEQVTQYHDAIQTVTLANAVPFIGPSSLDTSIKKFLFCAAVSTCEPVPPPAYEWLMISQNLISIVLIFFIGLALRNYFKIK